MIIVPILLVIFTFISSQASELSRFIETERTIWHPWRQEHTQQWEVIEKADESRLFFRRNEYFEEESVLKQRDHNWEVLSELLVKKYGTSTPFPPNGYAIFRKSDYVLIGAITFKFSESPEFVQFGYGFSPETRQQKYGSEIMTRLLKLADECIGRPLIQFNNETDRLAFFKDWGNQGKAKQPNWSQLLSYFSQEPVKFKGFQADVDIENPASLAVVYHQGMKPIKSLYEIVRYGEFDFYAVDIFFQYPPDPDFLQRQETRWVDNLLSRKPDFIQKTIDDIIAFYQVPLEAQYKRYNRALRLKLMALNTHKNQE
jgi:RimJ/RimL family protein N-acetyltransferase